MIATRKFERKNDRKEIQGEEINEIQVQKNYIDYHNVYDVHWYGYNITQHTERQRESKEK